MGLFSKKDRGTCVICGGRLPMFAYEIEGQKICDGCHGVISLPKEIKNNLTFEGFMEYRVFRERNDQLKQQFQITRQVDFGWFDDKFLFDTDKRLLCMDKKFKKPVFEGCQIKSFEIREDEEPLFRGSAEEMIRYTSTVPERVMAMAPQIEQLRIQADMRRDMERILEEKKKENNYTGSYSLPSINVPTVFRKFIVEIHFESPYWPFFTADKNGPEFSSTTPDVNDYLAAYKDCYNIMEELATALKEIAFPEAPERTVVVDSVVTAASGGAPDTVEELKRLKGLMDQGIITEEEFTLKKRKLLDIPL